MADLASILRDRAGSITGRRAVERTGWIGVWLLRVVLGVALVLLALSFVGPPPEASVAVGDDPAAAAHAAVHNLRAGTYQLSVEAERTVTGADPEPFLAETRIVDNRGHRYVRRRATDATLGVAGTGPERTYGTVTTGFRRPERGAGPDAGGGDWRREEALRYHPTVNAFQDVARLQNASATVVTDTTETYAVRIDDADVVSNVIALPGHQPRGVREWNATLTLSIARETDRLTRAEYRYRLPERGTVVRATYRFDYGALVDVDRPLGTYPPGDEVVGRLDHGLRAGHVLLGGGQR